MQMKWYVDETVNTQSYHILSSHDLVLEDI